MQTSPAVHWAPLQCSQRPDLRLVTLFSFSVALLSGTSRLQENLPYIMVHHKVARLRDRVHVYGIMVVSLIKVLVNGEKMTIPVYGKSRTSLSARAGNVTLF